MSRGAWAEHPTAVRYQWERCGDLHGAACVPVSGATAARYRVTGWDLGSRLRARVTATVRGARHRASTRVTTSVIVRPRPSPCSGIDVRRNADVARLVASAPPGTTFCFQPGRYRVTRTIAPRARDRLIGQPGAILDAGTVVRGWREEGSVWVAPAPRITPTFNYGGGYQGSYKYDQAVYADDVFENNHPLVKVGVRDGGKVVGKGPGRLRAGQYFYDYDNGVIYLGTDPTGGRVEIENLPDGVVHGVEPGVTIRGLTVQGSLGDGIVTGSGPGWTVEGTNVRLNHSEGLRVTNGGRILRNYIHDNGTYGIAATGNSMRITANEVARNNTARYYRADGECSDAGGSKITLSRNVTLNRNWYHDNLCIGIWFDINNVGVSIVHNHVDRNYENGIDYEISYDAVIRQNEVSGSWNWGILDSASPSVTISGNSVAGNGDGAIVLHQNLRTDFPSAHGPHYAQNVTVRGNRIAMRSGRAGASEDGVAGTPFAGVVFSATNRFDHNRYILRNLTNRWFEWAGGPLTIRQWRSAGHDRGSTFSVG